jgi:hypothetical protein
MIWFGSSAGVALSNMYPEAKSVANWVRHGWHVTLAYVVGFAVLMLTLGWQPMPKRGDLPAASVPAATAPAMTAPSAPAKEAEAAGDAADLLKKSYQGPLTFST